MSDESQGPGWWQASDGKWYSPEQAPGVQPPPPPQSSQPPQPAEPTQPAEPAPGQAPQWQSTPPQGAPAYQQGTVPAAGPPPKKSNTTRNIIIAVVVVFLLIAGGCMAVLVAGGLILDEAADQLEEEFTENEATADGRDDAGARDDPLSLGTEADLGNGWRVTVNSVDLDATDEVVGDGTSSPPSDGMRYISVNVTTVFDITGNLSPEDLLTESPMFAVGFVAYGSDDVERTLPGSFAQPPEPALNAFSALEQGGEATGNILLEVGEGENDLVLKVAPGISFDETEAWYDLESG